jgi:putative transcriptional regulator
MGLYHYDECGLDRVYLANGYAERETPYGLAVSIDDVDGLHRAIGRAIVQSPKPIDGAELRFLRKHLDLSQRELAALMGETEQDVYRWEKGRAKAIPGAADRLIRVIFARHDDAAIEPKWLLERLAGLDKSEGVDITFEEGGDGWKIAA